MAEKPPATSRLPDILNYQLFRSDGKSISFSSVLATGDTPQPGIRCLVIFIRHFFCGNCQQYLLTLSQQMPPASLPSDLSIAIVGCGAPSLIESYVSLIGCPWPVYADPSTKLYELIGARRTLSLGWKGPEYIQHNLFWGMVKSVRQGFGRVGKGDVRKAGDLDVNGGEFLFQSVDGKWKISWCHRMKNSRDHTEVLQLKKALAIDNRTPTQKPAPIRRATTMKLYEGISQKRRSWAVDLRRSKSTSTRP